MQVTIFSFFIAVFWSSIIVLIQYLFIKKREFVMMFGISSMLLLYIFSVARMLVPLELPFTKEFVSTNLWNRFYTYLCVEVIRVMGITFNRATILLLIWFAGAVILSSRYIVQYIKTISRISKYESIYNEQTDMLLKKVINIVKKPVKVNVLIVPVIQSPLGVGVLKKTILLPSQDYSRDELFYILLHEVTHFANKDIPLKILIHIFCSIFWWNPIVYLLRRDIDQLLEIKCDLAVTAEIDKTEKIKYLTTIVRIVKEQNDSKHLCGVESNSVLGQDTETGLIERFKIVSECKKGRTVMRAKLIWHMTFLCIILVSYSFVIQPKYSVPENEVVIDTNAFEVTKENSIIVQQNKEEYLLIHESGYSQKIEQETAKKMLEEGFQLKEEKEYEKK